ncbi:HD-GYP domain [Luteimonas sp. J16]|nr:HD-GYP domain [Luteimonas sp. J16]
MSAMRRFAARLRFVTPARPTHTAPMSVVLPAACAGAPSVDDAALDVLAAALDQRDPDTDAHCGRVSQLAALLGTHCDLGPQALGDLALAARFHDVGKIGIPDGVLLANRALEARDWDVMRTHPARGERLFLATAREDATRVARLIRHHHEAVDGSGYPDGLRGTQIPLECRVLSVVDAFDALTSRRPYRAPMPARAAMRRLGEAVGHQLDADVFAVFERLLSRVQALPV